MRKKIVISVSILIVVIIVAYLILTASNLTQDFAYKTAYTELSTNYADFGDIVETDIYTTYSERLVFPKYKLKSYTSIFVNEHGDTLRIEVSSYLPFWVMKSEVFKKILQ